MYPTLSNPAFIQPVMSCCQVGAIDSFSNIYLSLYIYTATAQTASLHRTDDHSIMTSSHLANFSGESRTRGSISLLTRKLTERVLLRTYHREEINHENVNKILEYNLRLYAVKARPFSSNLKLQCFA